MPFAFSVLVALLNVVLPLIEELYFRGYMLPRMKLPGGWAPVANAGLFSAYHLWAPSPADQIGRLVAVIPIAWLVWRLQDIRFGIGVHCTLDGCST